MAMDMNQSQKNWEGVLILLCILAVVGMCFTVHLVIMNCLIDAMNE